MSRVTASTNVQQVKPEEATRFIEIALQDIVRVVNGSIDKDNLVSRILGVLDLKVNRVNVTFSVPNVEVVIQHGLGFTPSGYIPTSMDIASTIYNSGRTSTATEIYLKATVATHADLLFF